MKIAILGTGCPKCEQLAQNVAAAVTELGLNAEIEKITDITAIMSAGVMMTPALTIDGQVKSQGKVLNINELRELLS